MPSLFDPVRIGDLTLKNRIIMAPLTRARSGVERVPGPLVAQYYAQRAGAGADEAHLEHGRRARGLGPQGACAQREAAGACSGDQAAA